MRSKSLNKVLLNKAHVLWFQLRSTQVDIEMSMSRAEPAHEMKLEARVKLSRIFFTGAEPSKSSAKKSRFNLSFRLRPYRAGSNLFL